MLGHPGDPALAQAFFSIYTMVMFLIIINIFIAVILEHLTVADDIEEQVLSNEDLDFFYEKSVWQRREGGVCVCVCVCVCRA